MIRIMKYGEMPENEIFDRSTATDDVSGIVSDIIADVRKNGDAALIAYAEKFDGAVLEKVEVTEDETDEAFASVGSEFLGVLERAAANIRAFHGRQVRNGFMMTGDGIVMGQKVTPIEKIGIYVPGGTAAYPSTVLMDAIPAKLAGCPLICMMTPPSSDGRVPSAILSVT